MQTAEAPVEMAPSQWMFIPRPMEEKDEDLIYGGWVESLRGQSPYREMRSQDYRPSQRKLIQEILSRPGVTVLVAQAQGKELEYGFCCGEMEDGNFILHYIYVRPPYRKGNIASGLLQFMGVRVGKTPIVATHWRSNMRHFREKWNLTYNPWKAWRLINE